jgi:hypothetical protein
MTAKLMVEWQRWVILDCSSQSHTTVHVRFAPKATIVDQTVIRRFVPIAT